MSRCTQLARAKEEKQEVFNQLQSRPTDADLERAEAKSVILREEIERYVMRSGP